MIVRTAAAALLVLALGAPSIAAPDAPSAPAPRNELYQLRDDASPLVGVELFTGGGLDRETGTQNGLAALAAETIVKTPVDGVPLEDAVDARGGSLTYVVEAQYVRFYLEAAPAAIAPLTALFARALAAPDASPAVLAAARASLDRRIADDERNPISVGIAMFRQSYYDGGAGLPTLGTAATLAGFTGADVRSFIAAHDKRGDAFVTAVGRVTPEVQTAAHTLVAALPAGNDVAVTTTTRPFPSTARKIVTQRDIGVTFVVIGFAAPSVGDKDFAAMLVLRSLLSDVFDRQSATTLPAFQRAIGAVYEYDTQPAALELYINGAQSDASAGLASVDAVLRGIATKPFPPALLKRYASSARGEWQTESVTLADRGFMVGNFVEHGVSPDYATSVLAAIDGVTTADVERVARTYLQKFTVALVLPREAPSPNS